MMENRDTQKKNIVIPWKHVEPQGAGHPIWGFVSTQINRRHSQTTNTKYLRLRKMIVANRAVERDNKTVLSIQTKKGSLNSRKYCCFVVYSAKFLGSCTQRKQDIWKWKAEKLHTDKLRRWKTWRPVLCGTQEEFAGWKSLGTERGKWRADRAAYPEGTEEGGRMITLPAMATTVPAGRLWFQRATNLLWDDEKTWMYSSPSPRCLWSRHTVAYETDGCFWPAVHRAEQ